jgi:SMC interacting uncharacterized protein involved in chromosome segregation
MSFAKETENIVNQLIKAEYKNACDNFGDKYHSLHEAYAVLLEEVEEVNNEFCALKSNVEHLWYSIKKNDTEVSCFNLGVMESDVISSMRELAQVGAVLQKIKNTLEGNA